MCTVNSGNDLVAPCGATGCCGLEDGATWKQCAELAEARADQEHSKLAALSKLCGATSDSGPTDDKTSLGDDTSGSEDDHVEFGGPQYMYETETDGVTRTPCNSNGECQDQQTDGPAFCVVEEADHQALNHVGFCESPCVCDSGQHDTKESSTAVIVIVVLAAVLLVAAAVYLGRKRRVAGLQLHRESIPTIGGDAGVEG